MYDPARLWSSGFPGGSSSSAFQQLMAVHQQSTLPTQLITPHPDRPEVALAMQQYRHLQTMVRTCNICICSSEYCICGVTLFFSNVFNCSYIVTDFVCGHFPRLIINRVLVSKYI